jgi:hypothetical protein
MANPASKDDQLRPEYAEAVFQGAIRGKHAADYQSGTNIVRLAPDVAADFPNEQVLNEALRFVQRIVQDAGRLTHRSA